MTDEQTTDAPRALQSAGTTGAPDADGPFVDAVFAALADWRRRELLQYFRETDTTTATVTELAFLLRAYEPDGTSRPNEELIEELTDEHLPRLAVAGAVEFDPRSETVRYRGQPTVEKWLDHVRAVDRREGDTPV